MGKGISTCIPEIGCFKLELNTEEGFMAYTAPEDT